MTKPVRRSMPMPATDLPPSFAWSTTAPELLVSDLGASLRF